MFLRNFDNYLSGLHLLSEQSKGMVTTLGQCGGYSSFFEDGYLNQRGTSGEIIPIYYYCSHSSGLTNPFNAPIALTTGGICLGDGKTAVTYEDYKLSGNIVENKLVFISHDTTYNSETKKWTKTLVASYNNSSDKDITISEWGLWRYNNPNHSNDKFSHNSSAHALMYREVLETPIVIKATTTGTLTFTIDIPTPNHP